MQIRARRSRCLDILRVEHMPDSLGPTLHSPDKDYEYRAYCTPEAFALALADLTRGIDYLKFKPTTNRYRDFKLLQAYNRIWGVVLDVLSTAEHRADNWHTQPPKRGARRGVSPLRPPARPDAWANLADDWSGGYGPVLPSGASAAARDPYLPEVWTGADDVPAAGGDPVLDTLFERIEYLESVLSQHRVFDHSKCVHGYSSNALARCRRRQRRNDANELEELRRQLDDYHEKLFAELGPTREVAQSSGALTVGGNMGIVEGAS